eukprot:TRINITY_DN9779_c1_g3_i1.p1 TRINITY_DN9779_c1_g3~~TRINITY_DN9779_c1_g3_i1.p1  ORF type:complete len:602 (+),score=102.01 TRINITY_DN9779_c1_g3_i1:861-2666(+)
MRRGRACGECAWHDAPDGRGGGGDGGRVQNADGKRYGQDRLTPGKEPLDQSCTTLFTPPMCTGADPNAADEDGETPLILAAQRRHAAVCSVLLTGGAALEAANKLGLTAARAAPEDLRVELMRQRTELCNMKLWDAIYSKRSEDAVALVQADGVDVNCTTGCARGGWSPLLTAATLGLKEVCVALLEAGAVADVGNKQGTVPLHVAAEEGCVGLCSILVQFGGTVGVRDACGETPLYKAARAGHTAAVTVLLEAGATLTPATNGDNAYSVNDVATPAVRHVLEAWNDVHRREARNKAKRASVLLATPDCEEAAPRKTLSLLSFEMAERVDPFWTRRPHRYLKVAAEDGGSEAPHAVMMDVTDPGTCITASAALWPQRDRQRQVSAEKRRSSSRSGRGRRRSSARRGSRRSDATPRRSYGSSGGVSSQSHRPSTAASTHSFSTATSAFTTRESLPSQLSSRSLLSASPTGAGRNTRYRQVPCTPQGIDSSKGGQAWREKEGACAADAHLVLHVPTPPASTPPGSSPPTPCAADGVLAEVRVQLSAPTRRRPCPVRTAAESPAVGSPMEVSPGSTAPHTPTPPPRERRRPGALAFRREAVQCP